MTNHDTHTQRQKILQFLQLVGRITTVQAQQELDVMHPEARILELRKRGHNIVTYRRTVNNGISNHNKVAEYLLFPNMAQYHE